MSKNNAAAMAGQHNREKQWGWQWMGNDIDNGGVIPNRSPFRIGNRAKPYIIHTTSTITPLQYGIHWFIIDQHIGQTIGLSHIDSGNANVGA